MGNFEYGFDRSEYLLKIVGWFSIKNNKIVIDRIYNKLLEELEAQKTPYNQMDITEKRRILMECYKSFKSDEFRYGLKGKTPKKIAQDFGEEMLGIQKRKYDMSDKFIPGLITTKELLDGRNFKLVKVEQLKADDTDGIPYVGEEMWSGFVIEQIGYLIYHDGENFIDDIKQYSVTIPTGYHTEIERTVFTKKIDYDLLGNDENYAEAIYTELLTPNNIDKTNAGGYIGEVVVSNKMLAGEEKEDDGGFYTYQISDKKNSNGITLNGYALSIDPHVVTACKILEKRQKAKNKNNDESR